MLTPVAILWVGLGGAIGSIARFVLGIAALRLFGDGFPWGTLAINVIGSFIIGFFGMISAGDGMAPAGQNARLFVTVGLCGGFTTFSTFSLQTVTLVQTGAPGRAGLYALLSVGLCVAGVWLGMLAGQGLNGFARR